MHATTGVYLQGSDGCSHGILKEEHPGMSLPSARRDQSTQRRPVPVPDIEYGKDDASCAAPATSRACDMCNNADQMKVGISVMVRMYSLSLSGLFVGTHYCSLPSLCRQVLFPACVLKQQDRFGSNEVGASVPQVKL